VLRRVLKVSAMNGWSVAIFAGLCSLVALAIGDVVGLAVSLLVTVAGGLEVQGNRLLKRGRPDGMRWLVRSQLVVLGVVWVYAGTQLVSFNAAEVAKSIPPDMRAALAQFGFAPQEIMRQVRELYYLLYVSVMAATLIYQGGLALYYRRRVPLVAQALTTPVPPPIETVRE
jgi:hypothetical protein